MTNDEGNASPRKRLFRPASFVLRAVAQRLPILVILAAGLVLVAPLLQGETLCTDDGALHIYRSVALDRAIADGLLYPRWFPDLAYGYGFPFFVYREPLNYYALEGLHLLGISIPNALNLVLAGSVILSGVAMFLLARDIFDSRGGLLAGIAYMTAPYMLIGPLRRGNLPEVIAFALMPLILLLFRRLVLFRQTRYFIASIISYAALLLTHNISSLLFTPLLVMYVALLGWVKSTDGKQQGVEHKRLSAIRDMRYALLAILLTLGLTAFFWFPALTEQDQAQLYLTHSTRGNDYHFNFISLGELLGGPGVFDPNLLNPPLRIPFGWPQIALAIIGVFAYRRSSGREQRVTIVAAGIAVLAFAVMALPISLPLWDKLPLIRFVQFPWRFVGRALLPAALLAAAVFSPHRTHRAQREVQEDFALSAPSLENRLTARVPKGGQPRGCGWRATVFMRWGTPGRMDHSAMNYLPLGMVIFIALIFTAPLSYPATCPTPHNLTITDVFAYERATAHIGVDPLGAYLPRTVIERPTGSPLEVQYAAGTPIQRFDATQLPDGARILAAQYRPNRADLSLSTPTAFTATYLVFDFPGWSVWIDEQPAETRPSEPTGLLTFDVPAGDHRIRIEFGHTPQRTIADSISLIALLAAAASAFLIYRRSSHPPTSQPTNQLANQPTLFYSLTVLLALAAFVLAKTLLVDAGLTPLRSTRLNGDTLAGVSHPLDVTFGGQLRLLGYDVVPSQTRPAETVRIDLYWKVLRPLDVTYQAEVGIADDSGWLWSPKHADRPRDYNDYPPTPQWPADAYGIDSFEIEALPGTPPGDYRIAAQVFDRKTLAPLQPSVASLPGRLAAPIGSIRVDRAARAFSAEQLLIYGGERHAVDPDLTLLGYNIDRVDTVPGDGVLLTLFWQAERAPKTDRRFRIELVNASNEVLGSKDISIGGEAYPTSRWNAGEQIISLAVMRVPAAAPSGEYTWRGSLLDSSGQAVSAFDMRPAFRVSAPKRTFDVPTMAHRVDVRLGDFTTLLGFDLAGDQVLPGGSIDMTLYWQVQAETTTAYKVFVHVLDAAGKIVAQADAFPVNGARPTPGWLPGEVIADRHIIALPDDLPADQYRIAAGLYDSESGARLRTGEGGEVVALVEVQVR